MESYYSKPPPLKRFLIIGPETLDEDSGGLKRVPPRVRVVME
jgi:hypothetical protein